MNLYWYFIVLSSQVSFRNAIHMQVNDWIGNHKGKINKAKLSECSAPHFGEAQHKTHFKNSETVQIWIGS